MKIEYSKNAQKQLDKIPNRQAKKILKKINALEEDVVSGKILQGKFAGFLSMRAWPYRIIYCIKEKTVIIVSIAHRQGVYK
ncbi:MAG: type II toxin-antitoxin system RelE/ParE family toxin [Microgenomates group bacterium]